MASSEEFCVSRKLINEEFEGYKLSLKQIPKTQLSLKVNIKILTPNRDQYSYKHTKLFALHNFLFHDFESKCSFYFASCTKNENVIEINKICGTWEEPMQVWTDIVLRQKQSYNCSLSFAGNDIAVVGDGAETLYILDMGAKHQKHDWSVLVKEVIDFPFVVKEAEYFSEEKELHCLLYHIVYEESKHKWLLTWLVYGFNELGEWEKKWLKTFKSSGDLFESCFSQKRELWIASESSFSEPGNDVLIQSWTQEDDEVIVTLPLNENDKSVEVHTDSNNICVKTKLKKLIDGKLYDEIHPDSTKWEYVNNEVRISLLKVEAGKRWKELLSVDNLDTDYKVAFGEETVLNMNQMEECDYPHSTNNVLECFSKESLIKSLKLSSCKVLFKVTDETRHSVFAIQHEDHIILWNVETETHCGTLPAMGYIQASKQRKKFLSCCPNLKYSIVCENSGHLFIYRHEVDVGECDLRNRTSCKRIKKIAQQQVINFKNEDIWGMHCADDVLYILAENLLFLFDMNE